MPSHPAKDKPTPKHLHMQARNARRFKGAGKPSLQKQQLGKLARRGLTPALRTELKQLRGSWVPWVRQGGGGQYTRKIRVRTDTALTSRAGGAQSFVGIGLDEHLATRLLKARALWSGISKRKARNVFDNRSRTADLVWYNPPPNQGAAPGSWQPIAGHTPSIKSAAVGGTKSAITEGHGNGRPGSGRDGARELAVERTRQDTNSPRPFSDTLVMGTLATIKHMSDPSTRLKLARPHVKTLPTPRYAALTGNKDLRKKKHFKNLVAHVQEERERKKWEVGSVMRGDKRLKGMVPPVIRSYLKANANRPLAAMEAFRKDVHNKAVPPPVNTSVESDTRNLATKSLHQMATKTNTSGRRQRSLSDARMLPVAPPQNSRGH
ncbi:hypothetical protein [Dyella sp. 2RAB6]|uniref:hypothetical protein n=1 Tax=Dyella sp. 2RAB6 TaxID=3232992 RepID=UPI003F9182F3